MKILLTGATGYVGSRLLALLAEAGHRVVTLVRNGNQLVIPSHLKERVSIIEADLLNSNSLPSLPTDIDAAYYLIHSMGQQASGFAEMEAKCARNFNALLSKTQVRQVVYLSGLSHKKATSEHMSSRHHVESILREGKAPVTILRAGIIIGLKSASFEIMSDLVRKLPIMIGPKWIHSRCQPIAIADVLFYLQGVLDHPQCLNQTFELGGPDTLTYHEMLLQLAKIWKLKRWIITVPVLTPYLSSLWLFFVTSTNFSLAQALVESLTTDAVCSEHRIRDILSHQCLDFNEAVKCASQ